MPLPPALIAPLLGAALAACGLPLPWSFLSYIPLALLLAHVASAPDTRAVAFRLWWAGGVYSAVHLWWLTAFLAKLFGTPLLGALALVLFALEGAFLAAVALVASRLVRAPEARVWAIAGGWVVLEWLRFLGPLAFPWPTLGYTLLPTPAIQIADLGGVLLGSVVVAATAAALVSFWWGRRGPLTLMAAVWIAALAYGVTRLPGEGPVARALLLRTTFDTFGRASRLLTPEEQFAVQLDLTRRARGPGEVVIWSESAILDPALLPQAPAGGLYGVSSAAPRRNSVQAWTGERVTSQTDKARPVPFGEYFPLRAALAPAWEAVERAIGFGLESVPPARTLTPLVLNGVTYGAYVCYDSVFPWVARQLARGGAQVLVNASNDGWYDGWGVQQHFQMGRVRAIETRRWVLRSVNEGVAATVNDLGEPVQTLARGQGTLHGRPRLLTGETPYVRYGDAPALFLAGLMLLYARRLDGAKQR